MTRLTSVSTTMTHAKMRHMGIVRWNARKDNIVGPVPDDFTAVMNTAMKDSEQ